MAADKHQQKSGDDQETMPMGQQGASYSSSYNESTPGEIEANRRRSLHEQESGATTNPDEVNQDTSRGNATE